MDLLNFQISYVLTLVMLLLNIPDATVQTKIRLYNVYILPVLLYGADTWSMTVASSRRLDAFDQWCLRRIVHIPYTAHITKEEVRCRTGQPPVTSVMAKRRLRLFGHLARADPSQEHSRMLRAAINCPRADWRRQAGRPRQTWLRTIELDLRPHNLGLNTALSRIVQSGVSLWRRLCSRYSMMMNCSAEIACIGTWLLLYLLLFIT